MALPSQFDGLSPYLGELRRTRVLSRDEELALTRRMKRGDLAARDEVVRSNLPFVISVARKFAGRGSRLEDLVQVGNLGLLRAPEDFEPETGNRFLSYAVWWIRAYVMRHCKVNRSEVRGGGDERASFHDVSLDAMADDEEGSALERLLGTAPAAEEQYLARERDASVRRALATARPQLDDLRWEIVQERFAQDSPTTLKVLGQRRGMSGERVRQVEARTRALLRCYLADVG
jgi:RNA polymerase primary sigma factor